MWGNGKLERIQPANGSPYQMDHPESCLKASLGATWACLYVVGRDFRDRGRYELVPRCLYIKLLTTTDVVDGECSTLAVDQGKPPTALILMADAF